MHFFLNSTFKKQPTFSFYSTGVFEAQKLKNKDNKFLKKGWEVERKGDLE